MSAAAVATWVIAGLLVVALAAYLLWVLAILRHLVDTLGKVTFGVRAIAYRVEPLTPVLTGVNADLVAVAEALEALSASSAPRSRGSARRVGAA